MGFSAWLETMVEKEASDLFITVGAPPTLKIEGNLFPLNEPVLDSEETEKILLELIDEKERLEFLKKRELNFAIFRPNLGRFRVSAFQQRTQKGAVIRRILNKIPTIEQLNLPEKLLDLSLIKRGLVLLVGGTGTGKSSSLAAMIGHRNHTVTGHVICIEDPIEYIHEHDKCIITQREVGVDTESFEIALKNSLRQAPDVILIGEIRSTEVMQYALQFAETGHLCLATLHSNNANEALDRIASFFPNNQHAQLWMSVSLNLKAIVAQRLIPSTNNNLRIPAVEIMINTPVIADHIRKGEMDRIKEFMTMSNEVGMHSFDQDLFRLYSDGKITEETAIKYADSENELRLKIKLNPKGKRGFSLEDFKGLE